MKKNVRLLLVLFLAYTQASATTYYVDPLGNDNNNGISTSTAWQTLTKVNAHIFVAGDNILFIKGGVWNGTIKIRQSGLNGKPITWSSYGSGANPLISGFVITSGWKNVGGGIWTYTNPSLGSTVNILTINGKPQGFGRFPKTGYNTYSTSNGTVSITDAGLKNSPSFVGGEVCIRKNHWTLSRGIITSQSSGVITYTGPPGSSVTPRNGFGYFIQNNINCLTQFGDWCYNATTKTISMYFGAALPTSFTIKVSNTDALVTFLYQKSYNIFSGLSFEGGNTFGINGGMALSNNYNQINNCVFNNFGDRVIYFGNCTGITINNNQIYDCMSNAILCTGSTSTITNNTVNRVGQITGMAQSGDGPDGAGASVGISAGGYLSTGTLVKFNTITNVGYNALYIRGDTYLADSNYIDTFCTNLDDGGGIYTDVSTFKIVYKGRTIINNIVLNGIGAPTGAGGVNAANGIYADDNSSNLTITNNTVANCGQHGYFLHNNHEITFTNNFAYNNGISQLTISHDNINPSLPRNLNISGNTLVANSPAQLCLYFYSIANNSTVADFTNFGTADNNNYRSLFSNTNIIITQLKGGSNVLRTLNSWQSYSAQEAHSTFIIPIYKSVSFQYNITTSNKYLKLAASIYKDVLGSLYTGTITMTPFTSVLLLLQNGVRVDL